MMKKRAVSFVLGILLLGCAFWLTGCGQLGETRAEGHRRHLRKLRIDNDTMMEDLDKFFYTDTPSKLTSRRIP